MSLKDEILVIEIKGSNKYFKKAISKNINKSK